MHTYPEKMPHVGSLDRLCTVAAHDGQVLTSTWTDCVSVNPTRALHTCCDGLLQQNDQYSNVRSGLILQRTPARDYI